MADGKLRIKRNISIDECPWLDKSISEDTTVYRYSGVTYGCIGAGLAVSLVKGTMPFFEVPRDAVEDAA